MFGVEVHPGRRDLGEAMGTEGAEQHSAGGAPAHKRRGPKGPSVLVHVPKTAGTSLTTMLLRSEQRQVVKLGNVFKGGGGVVESPDYGRMRSMIEEAGPVGLITGHVPLGLAEFLPRQWRPRYLTFLRDPVERALSHYFHILNPVDPRAEPDESDADVTARSGIVEQPEEPVTAHGDPLRADMPYDEVLSDLRYVPDNLHTRMLCGMPEPFGDVTTEMLEMAKHNLEHKIAVFGLVERFDESAVLLKHRLGYGGILTPVLRSNARRPRGDAVPAELVEAARRANRVDMELYEFAKDLFERAPERQTQDFQIDLAVLRQARADDSGEGTEQPAPPDYPGDAVGWSLLLGARVDRLRLETELGMIRRKLRETRASLTDAKAALQTRESSIARLRARTTDLNKRLQGSKDSVAGLEHRAKILEGQIAAETAHLARIKTRREGLDDSPLNADELDKLTAKAAHVEARRDRLVSQQATIHARLREPGGESGAKVVSGPAENPDSIPSAPAKGTDPKRVKKPKKERAGAGPKKERAGSAPRARAERSPADPDKPRKQKSKRPKDPRATKAPRD